MNVVKETNQAQSPELLLPSGLSVIPTFAAFLPEFSGFASAGWAALISGPRRRAAESRLTKSSNAPRSPSRSARSSAYT
jgi:hypothetical protein